MSNLTYSEELLKRIFSVEDSCLTPAVILVSVNTWRTKFKSASNFKGRTIYVNELLSDDDLYIITDAINPYEFNPGDYDCDL